MRIRLGGIATPVQLQCHSVTLWKREVHVYVARQADLGLRAKVLPDRDVWVYGDTLALNALAAVFDGVARFGGVALLERYAVEGADLLIFQRVPTPFNFPEYRRLRQQLHGRRPQCQVAWEAKPEAPEDWKDGEWKWDNQVTIRANGNGVLIAGSPIGLRYCALGALRIEEWQGGHTHIFWSNTSRSTELTIAYDDYRGP